MATKEDTATKPESINPMLEWWSGMTANGQVDREMKRCQALAADMQSLATEAYRRQMKAFSAANERVGAAVSEFAACRQHVDVAATASKLFADLMEVGSQQARVWADLSQTLRGRAAAVADELARRSEVSPAKTAGEKERAATGGEKERASAEPALKKSA